jgi:hypothetical protein
MIDCPYNWKDWCNELWTIACGGNEIPCNINGKWYLMVLNLKENKYYYYCFNEDVFKTDKEFEEIKSSMQSKLNFAKRWNAKQN